MVHGLLSSPETTPGVFYSPGVLLQDIAAEVQAIKPEKSSKVQEANTFLASNSTCASAPHLHSKVDEVNKKYLNVEQLLQCSQEKYAAPRSLCVCMSAVNPPV